MREFILSVAVAAALAPVAFAKEGKEHAGHDHKAHAAAPGKGEVRTIEGEIVDMACFLGHDGTGEKHKKCAKACVLKGTPAGVLGADGSLYLLVEDHANAKAYDQAKKLAGEKAKITGKVVEKGGVRALMVTGAQKG